MKIDFKEKNKFKYQNYPFDINATVEPSNDLLTNKIESIEVISNKEVLKTFKTVDELEQWLEKYNEFILFDYINKLNKPN
jgi:hypothetical protein